MVATFSIVAFDPQNRGIGCRRTVEVPHGRRDRTLEDFFEKIVTPGIA